MTTDQTIIIAILVAAVGMFLWGRWRHDMVAMGALLLCVAAGVVPGADAFAGFGHPAVITVACVLVLSRGLQTSGAVDALARRVLPANAGPTVTIAAVTGLAAVLSAFMNNVGALALLMPIAIQTAAKLKLPPGKVLMPLAFGSILGGMTTLIGTPPNLIVSSFRVQNGSSSFAMFDFTPVGLAVAAVGVIFVAAIGWRLVPTRERIGADDFDTGTYFTEARIPENAKAAGMTLREVEKILDQADAQVVGLIRNDVRVSGPSPTRRVWADDILVIEAEPKTLATALSALGLKLAEELPKPDEAEAAIAADPNTGPDGAALPAIGDADSKNGQDEKVKGKKEDAKAARQDDKNKKENDPGTTHSDEIALIELVVLPDSALVGRSATDIRLRTSYGINLLAISRQGIRSMARLRTMPMRAGDVLLMQGTPESVAEFATNFSMVPLAERTIRLPDKRQAILASVIMAVAVAGAALGLVPAAIAFAGGMLATMAFRVVPPRKVYEAIDWPVIVLLGALIPVAGAIESTGAAELIARVILDSVARGHAIVALTVILIVTMTLSDFMNNAATAAVMCPIAIGTAASLGVSADPFLMAVAIGASCAFLTPIGHQNNTLILGPGGFHFGDYWKLGLPLEILVVLVSVPMLLLVWPF
ncbi:MAG: SLC13 family permease [Pseudolabrys sp.]|nr:SLC13 family permease [Pseudolabrys sp.]